MKRNVFFQVIVDEHWFRLWRQKSEFALFFKFDFEVFGFFDSFFLVWLVFIEFVVNVLKYDNQIAGDDGEKIGYVPHFWVILFEIQEVVFDEIRDLVNVFIQVRDEDANDLVVVKLINSGNCGSDKEHVRDFDDVDFVDIGSFEELY